MSTSASAVLKAAAIWRGRRFSQAGYGASPYCASFVRWCFERATGKNLGLPEVTRVPYYVRKGIHVSPGAWFADSLAGDEVGPVVTAQQPGDLVFFHDTADGPWPRGSITHIGIATDNGDQIVDAGSGSLVHFRSHRATFPDKLVEIRRPLVLGAAHPTNVHRSAILISHGHAFGMARGKHLPNVELHLSSVVGSGATQSSVLGGSGGGGSGPTHGSMFGGGGYGGGGGGHGKVHGGAHVPQVPQSKVGSAPLHWVISVNGQTIKPVQAVSADIIYGGNRFKLFGHDHRGQAFLNGARLTGAIDIKVKLQNGAAHVWIDGKEVKPEHVEMEVVG
ncbi:MAG: hypothetical protein ABL985_12710 [Casimicrobium sp.]